MFGKLLVIRANFTVLKNSGFFSTLYLLGHCFIPMWYVQVAVLEVLLPHHPYIVIHCTVILLVWQQCYHLAVLPVHHPKSLSVGKKEPVQMKDFIALHLKVDVENMFRTFISILVVWKGDGWKSTHLNHEGWTELKGRS